MAFEEANNAVDPERSISSENQDYKSFLRVVGKFVCTWSLYARGGRKLITHTYTTTTVTLAAHENSKT